MVDNNKVQESWNMGTETLKRLARDLDLCTYYSHTGDLIAWFYSSMSLRRNLSAFLDDEEFKTIDNKIKEFPCIVGGRILPNHYAKAHKVLDEFYMLAVTNMKSKGLLMPKSQDPRAAVISN